MDPEATIVGISRLEGFHRPSESLMFVDRRGGRGSRRRRMGERAGAVGSGLIASLASTGEGARHILQCHVSA
jgi:hypothetical protein